MPSDPAARPFRWIGAIAVLGVVSAALAVLAWEAIGESFTYIGDGRAQSDAIILATEGVAGDGSSPAATTGEAEDAEAADDEQPLPPATYEVQPGDTGSSIARELFGRQDAWPEIAAYNDLPPSATLSVGQELRIPEL